jgi:outer membrane biosynthesis protein TonB
MRRPAGLERQLELQSRFIEPRRPAKTVARFDFLRQTPEMAGIGKKIDSLRLSRLESERLVLALMISLAAHLATFGGYELNRYFGWSQSLRWPVWLHHPAKIQPQTPLLVKNSEPAVFIDVNPEQAAAEPPQNAKFYSSKNSRAANPDASRDTDTPKLNGKQTDVPKTEDAPRQNFNHLQPQMASAEQQEAKAKIQTGDLTLGRPEDSQKPEEQRPRTIRQALAQNHLQGVQMKQDGGVQRRAVVPSFDALGTSFGTYDAAIIEAIQQYWDDELDSQKFAQDRTGKVTVRFHLNYDGTVTDMQVLDNTVGELLCYVCQQAITGSAPYAPWPSDMRREIGANFREITFTFYYY